MKRIATIVLMSLLLIFSSMQSVSETTDGFSAQQTTTEKVNRNQQAKAICKNFVLFSNKIYDLRQKGIPLEKVLTKWDANVADKYDRNSPMYRMFKKGAIGIYGEYSHLTRKDLLSGYYVKCMREFSSP